MLVLTSLVSAGLKKAVEHFYFHDTPTTYVSNTCIRSYLRQLAIGYNAWSARVCTDIKHAGSLGSMKEAQELLKAQPKFSHILVKYFSCVRKKGIEVFRNGHTLDKIAL